MIVYGTRAKALASESIMEACPNCHKNNSITLIAFTKYAHVFWIPFFPYKKVVASECVHCKQVLTSKEFPSSLSIVADEMKSRTKNPIWAFSGLALFIGLIVLGFVSSKNDEERIAKLLAAPKAGDELEIRTEDRNYTIYKIEEVEGETIVFKVNSYETNKISGISDIREKGEAAYTADLFSITKKELQAMADRGEVIDVDRK